MQSSFCEDAIALSKEDGKLVQVCKECRAVNAENKNAAGKRLITYEWMNTEHCCLMLIELNAL
jgi:hypothetical protein